MIQVEFFHANTADKLKDDINSFLKTFIHKVVDIKYSSFMTPQAFTVHYAMLIYDDTNNVHL